MVCRFLVVMAWGRVGSNLLMNLIGQAKIRKKLNSEKFNQLKTAEEQIAWFRDFYDLDRAPEVRLIGSKQNVLSMRDIGAVVDLVRTERVKLIRMRRDNLLKAAVSQIRAEEYAKKSLQETGTARWAVRRGEPVLGPSHIDPELLVRRMGVFQQQHQRMIDSFSGFGEIDVEYEQLISGLPFVYTQVADCLGLSPELPEVPFVKATPDDLRAAITNYYEVATALADTPYGKFLQA
jgi:LPS sulfotransferase NodH